MDDTATVGGRDWVDVINDVNANALAWYSVVTQKSVQPAVAALSGAVSAQQAPVTTYVASNAPALVVLGLVAVAIVLLVKR